MNYLKTMVAGATLLSALNAFAEGGKVGGGGAAMVCMTRSHTSVQLLDLYQAKTDSEHPISVISSGAPMIRQLNAALNRIESPGLSYLLKVLYQRTLKINKLPNSVHLSKSYDLGDDVVIVPDHCSIEWVAYYKDQDERLQIVTKYFDLMSATDQAALYAHELIYRWRREYGDLNSAKTRKIVGWLFAKDQTAPEELATLLQDVLLPIKVAVLPSKPTGVLEIEAQGSFNSLPSGGTCTIRAEVYSPTLQWILNSSEVRIDQGLNQSTAIARTSLNIDDLGHVFVTPYCAFKHDSISWTLKINGQPVMSGSKDNNLNNSFENDPNQNRVLFTYPITLK